MNNMEISVLDCTLRDGGYYCDWDFDESIVKKYLTAVSKAKVDIVEIGFRFLPQKGHLGHFAYSTDEYLETLALPSNLDIAVMVNAKEIIEAEMEVDAVLNLLFSKKSESLVDIVRIAAHIGDIEQCKGIINKLQKLGYRVFLNLMQIDSIDKLTLRNIAKQIESWNTIEVLYFADSLGSMNFDSIKDIVEVISSEWSGNLGIHAHDNKGHALINSLSAIDCGVSYIDATILGMGRGAGNANMEILLVEINDRNIEKYYPGALYPLVLNDFEQLKMKYKWGSNVYYYLSAVHGIHPTYIQEMMEDNRYDVNQILSTIDFLKSNGSSSYSFESMLNAIANSSGEEHGDWNAKDWAKGRDILIIGSGESVKTYLPNIIKYIKDKNPIVISLNINKGIHEDLITAYIACHETRITIEMDLYKKLTKPLILPIARIPIDIKESLSDIDILDYGLKVKEGEFKIYDNGCILSKPLVFIYALSLSSISGANKVLLVGIDGYKVNNPKQQELINGLDQFKENITNLEFYSITPTTFPIKQLNKEL